MWGAGGGEPSLREYFIARALFACYRHNFASSGLHRAFGSCAPRLRNTSASRYSLRVSGVRRCASGRAQRRVPRTLSYGQENAVLCNTHSAGKFSRRAYALLLRLRLVRHSASGRMTPPRFLSKAKSLTARVRLFVFIQLALKLLGLRSRERGHCPRCIVNANAERIYRITIDAGNCIRLRIRVLVFIRCLCGNKLHCDNNLTIACVVNRQSCRAVLENFTNTRPISAIPCTGCCLILCSHSAAMRAGKTITCKRIIQNVIIRPQCSASIHAAVNRNN